jgi:predicted nucleotidyltransferase component of viral defense system
VIDPRADKGDFADLCRIAADALGGNNPMLLSILEKDYWVTRVLCAIAEQHSDDVVFKGGTSLSKGLGLTQRFSEDIDLAIDVGDRGESSRDTLLKAIARDVANSCSLEASVRESGKGVHRAIAYSFDAIWAGGEVVKPSVLLEMGTRSALAPVFVQSLQTLIAIAVPRTATELPSCKLRVLSPDRTLVEKLFVIHACVTRYLSDTNSTALNRIGRHYYDVAKLLGDPPVNASVGTTAFWEMAQDHDSRGAREFPKHHIGPPGLDFQQSQGLFPDGQLANVLRREYERDRVLFFGNSPSFDEALAALVSVRSHLSR